MKEVAAWLNRTSPRPYRRRSSTAANTTANVFIDHYEWLRDKESEEVLNYLKAEAEYTEAVTADQQPPPRIHLQRNQGPHPAVGSDRPEPYR